MKNNFRLNTLVRLPSSSNQIKHSLYLNLLAEHTGVLDFPHQEVQASSILASAKDEDSRRIK